MAELIVNLDVILPLVAISLVTLILGQRYFKSPGYLRQRINDRDLELKDWKHKFNVLKGLHYRMANAQLVEPEKAKQVMDSGKISDAIPSLLESAAPYLPKGLAPIAKNPQIQGWLKGLAEKYPSEAKQFLGGMLPKLTAGSAPGSKTSTKGL